MIAANHRGRGAAAAMLAAALLAAPVASHGGAPGGEGALGGASPVMVVDLHVDLPWQVHVKGRSKRLDKGHARMAALRAGNYAGLVFPIYLPDRMHADGPHIEDADAILATIDGIVAAGPELLPLGSTRAEPGRISTFLAVEGAGAFAADITQIDRFIARGVRLISPNHGKNTALSSSATDKPTGAGLTELGRRFCERVYAAGALIDVSHVSDATFADLVPIARAHGAPIVATHSNARAIAKHARNLTDEQLLLIGETGGVAGLNFHAPFVNGTKEATLEDVLRQADHMIQVAGIDHVAIGSDFDGGITPVKGLDDASALPALAARLKQRGMSHEDVLKIFSLNALRVLGWQPSAEGRARKGGPRTTSGDEPPPR